MNTKGMGRTVQVAQKLVNHLPEEMNIQLKKLILQAEESSDPLVETKILDLLTSHENVRRWMKEEMKVQSGRSRFDQLAGDPSAPVSNRWICPKDSCETLPVIQEGEPAPRCDRHKTMMIREKHEGR